MPHDVVGVGRWYLGTHIVIFEEYLKWHKLVLTDKTESLSSPGNW